jgi:hypothetical protein
MSRKVYIHVRAVDGEPNDMIQMLLCPAPICYAAQILITALVAKSGSQALCGESTVKSTVSRPSADQLNTLAREPIGHTCMYQSFCLAH